MPEETEKPAVNETTKRDAAKAIANKILLVTMTENPAEAIKAGWDIAFHKDVPPEAIVFALEETMPKEWREFDDLGRALFDAPENTLRAILVLSSLYYHLGYSKGYFSATKKLQTKKA